MKFYSILHNTAKSDIDDKYIALSNQFCISAFMFGIIWLIYNNMWRVSAVVLLFIMTIGYLESIAILNNVQGMIFCFLISIYIGLEGNDLKTYTLQKHGYIMEDIIYANSEDEALFKYYTKVSKEWK